MMVVEQMSGKALAKKERGGGGETILSGLKTCAKSLIEADRKAVMSSGGASLVCT